MVTLITFAALGFAVLVLLYNSALEHGLVFGSLEITARFPLLRTLYVPEHWAPLYTINIIPFFFGLALAVAVVGAIVMHIGTRMQAWRKVPRVASLLRPSSDGPATWPYRPASPEATRRARASCGV